jgi:hypothetical protein
MGYIGEDMTLKIKDRNSRAEPDTHCDHCGLRTPNAESRWRENPDLTTGEYPSYVCDECARKEYETCVMEYEWQVQEEKWAHQKKKHEEAKAALREQDVEVLDDYRATPRF